MHKIRFQLGPRPRPRWESLQRSPDFLAGFKGPTSKGRAGKREWRGREREREEMRGKRRERKEGGGGA